MRSTESLLETTISFVTSPAERLRHRRAPRPIVFPVEEQVPESKRHFKLRTALYAILELALGKSVVLGSDQFVYWNARDPRRCLAPDVFVFVGRPDEDFKSWKSWERGGPPQLAIEIVSESDDEPIDSQGESAGVLPARRPIRWSDKLERYHELGVRELVRFDADAEPGARLQVWDRIDDDLVERAVEDDATTCVTLGLDWVVAPLANYPLALRLARGGVLLKTSDEARADADQRIAELEAELASRR